MRFYFMFSDRLGFSHWQQSDEALARELWGDEAVTKYIAASGHFSPGQVQARLYNEIESQRRYGVQYWPLFLMESGQFIGCCGLRPYQLKNRMYELGFHLKEAFWGRGLGREAAKTVKHFAFTNLEATALFAGHHPQNSASKKMLAQLGFVYVGEEYYTPTGLCHPSYLCQKDEGQS